MGAMLYCVLLLAEKHVEGLRPSYWTYKLQSKLDPKKNSANLATSRDTYIIASPT